MPPLDETHNPLLSDSPGAWDRLIESIGPAGLLVVIHERMGARLLQEMDAQDVFQEALTHAFRDRARFEWRGTAAFRAWILTIAENRIRDLLDRLRAQKRGGDGRRVDQGQAAPDQDEDKAFLDLLTSTTAGRLAQYREQARIMRRAVETLPEALRDVVRLRIFDELSTEQIAERLGLGLSAVKHRFLKGATLYHERLKRELAASSAPPAQEV